MMIPYDPAAYDLFHEGTIALAQIEANGMRVDTGYLDQAITDAQRKIKRLSRKLGRSREMRIWRKRFGQKANLQSGPQLAAILFEELGFEQTGETEKGQPKVDDEALEKIDSEFVRDLLSLRSERKTLSTYLMGIRREVVDGFVHPFFSLNTVTSYRSSSQAPNFQNIPMRQPEIAKLVRRMFIPRPGHVIVECDYSGIEVRIAACYHKDPRMIEYICDTTKDLHRDMALECFRLTPEELGDVHVAPGKLIRYCGKNMFVFPQFYGDWYQDCARSLWSAIDKFHMTTAAGLSLKDHLRRKGIKALGVLDPKRDPAPGTFASHLKQVENRFWGKRFPTYAQWKKDWYESYRKRGWYKTKTGFICQGMMRRNECINYGIQGSAFHCLLRALIWIVLQELPKRKMKAKVVGQIHDSLVSEVPIGEVDDYLQLCQQMMVRRLMRFWEWIIVPLEIEAEVSPEGGSWADKKKVEIGG